MTLDNFRMNRDSNGNAIIASGGNLFQQCGVCGKWVQINKWFFGSLHVCDSVPIQDKNSRVGSK